ncbi:hypothetical protein NKH60_26685 [Mesorhizobium sp. M1006]|uniref:hypothetical protein n=1 Tax=Mesorhizobium sp. M1006 TaxID=2957048 RepID=UPI003335AD31
MRKTDLEDIRSVIHRVRAERFSHLDEQFLDAVLDAEARTLGDDAGAVQLIRRAVDVALAKMG